jgi:hypothetical protein
VYRTNESESDIAETRAHLREIDTKLLQLNCIEDLEEKAVKSMKYHVKTNTALTEVQGQMSEMMTMLRNMATQSSPSGAGLVTPTSTAVTQSPGGQVTSPTEHHSQGNVRINDPAPLFASRESCSAASSSSGSHYAKPPPNKHFKRSMADAKEQTTSSRTLEQAENMDSVSANSFGSTPPQTFQILGPSPPLLALSSASQLTVSDIDFVPSSDQPLHIPDLDDQYKLTDEEFNAPYTPDRVGEG